MLLLSAKRRDARTQYRRPRRGIAGGGALGRSSAYGTTPYQAYRRYDRDSTGHTAADSTVADRCTYHIVFYRTVPEKDLHQLTRPTVGDMRTHEQYQIRTGILFQVR
eukprot:3940349-Rhodomonas_salina.2